MPPRKRIAPDQTHGYIGDKPKSKPKPRIIIEPPWLTDYIYKRDQYWLEDMFTSEETKLAILKKRNNERTTK